MTIYKQTFVYWIHLPEHTDIYSQGYVGVSENPTKRLKQHLTEAKNNTHVNPYLLRVLNKHSVVQTILYSGNSIDCYTLELHYRPKKLIGWNINKGGICPPSKKGWRPSEKTLSKRSNSLKGIVRSETWCQNLSESKKGEKNGMFGKNNPCSEQKRLTIIRAKNLKNYELYKQAIALMNNGLSADKTAVQLSIGRGVCFALKNRSHMFFEAFPELK